MVLSPRRAGPLLCSGEADLSGSGGSLRIWGICQAALRQGLARWADLSLRLQSGVLTRQRGTRAPWAEGGLPVGLQSPH